MNAHHHKGSTTSHPPARSLALYWWVAGAFFAIGTTAVSCSCRREQPQAQRPDTTPPPVEKEERYELTANVPVEACGERRRLALRTENGSCPSAGGKILHAEGPLSLYCVYEKPATSHGDNWGPDPDDRIDDCPVYVQANETQLLAWRDSFERKVGLVQSQDMPSNLLGGSVEIAVIDTAGTNVFAGESDHGPLMASIVRDLSGGCLDPGAQCMRTVRTYPGLPLSLDDNQVEVRDPTRGGYYGSTLDVATAIVNAVNEAKTRGRLIINLSLAWTDPNQKTGILSPVYVALQYAASKGALIVVAAGNHPPNFCPNNAAPMYPAAWVDAIRVDSTVFSSFGKSDLYKSDFGLMERIGILQESMSNDTARQPLLYPISAVGREGPLLSSSRDTSLAAFGYRAVSRLTPLGASATTGRWLGPMSGTSVSAAVVSGIAALVWSARPEFEPHDVMRTIWQQGDNFSPAEIPLDQQQHVAMACNTLQAFCSEAVLGEAAVLYEGTVLHEGASILPSSCPVCPSKAEASARPLPRRSLSTRRINAISAPVPQCDKELSAVVKPQPDVPVCPSCSIEPSYTNPPTTTTTITDAKLNLQLSSEYSSFEPVTLRVTLYSSRETGSIAEVNWYAIDNIPPTDRAVSITATQMSSYTAPALNYIEPTPGTSGTTNLTPDRAWIEIYFTDANGKTFSAGNDLDIKD